MEMDDRPVLRCFVSLPIGDDPDEWTEPALVSLALAEELQQRGYIIVGPDPQDERDLAIYERFLRASQTKVKKVWFER